MSAHRRDRRRDPRLIRERYWSKVGKSPGCWEWTGSRDRRGYGFFCVGSLRLRAHRFAYELAHGPFRAGAQVLHRCHHRGCVNPKHLEIGGHSRNMQQRMEAGRTARGERNGRARLTAAAVTDIRKRVAAGEPQRSVARAFNISHTAVQRICDRRTWPHV